MSETTPASTSSLPIALVPVPLGIVDELLGGGVAPVRRLEPDVLPPSRPRTGGNCGK